MVYNIWCAGLSPQILVLVAEKQQEVWESLCEPGELWKDIYKEDRKPVNDVMFMILLWHATKHSGRSGAT